MSILNGLFNKKEESSNFGSLSVKPEDIYASATLELQDIIAPSALQILPTALNLGDHIVRSFYIVGYPSTLTDNWLTPIINLDRVFDISIHVNPIDTAKILSQFQKKVAEVQSQISEKEQKGVVRDPMLESAYRDLESLRDGLQQAQEKMFEVGIYISIYAQDEQELFKAENEIKGTLDSQMIFLKPATFQQDVGFLSIIPTALDELKVYQKMNTAPLSSTFPFVSFDLTGDKGILYGINRHNNSLIIFDRFSLENYNSVTFAKSGSGKSFATKLEILRSLMFDTDVIVIDPEREYEYLSDAVGGRYFNISLTSDHHINPFDLSIPTKDETAADVLRQNTINLVGLFRVMLGGLTPEEDAIIDRAITETYALKDITPESDFSNIEPPLLSDMAVVLAGMEGAESILRKLEKYTIGSWSGFLNRPSNVDINRKFVIFSIRDMEDELKPIAMYIVTHFIWNEIRKNLRKRLMVVDEAWWMMKNEDTASFLYSIAKRGRKYYLGLATITQDVEDFLKSPWTPYFNQLINAASLKTSANNH
jgi:type IV secretory pathway VirB4 component